MVKLLGFTMVLNFIGGILMLTTDFGGMVIRVSGGYRDRWASLGSEYAETADNVFIVLLAICMFIMAALSLIALLKKQSNTRKLIGTARVLGIVTLVLAIISGFVYNAIRDEMDYWNWWLDTGFYTAIVVGVLSTILYSVYLRKYRAPLPVSGQTGTTTTSRPVEGGGAAKDLDYIEKLKKLALARDKGLITQEEFDNKKKEILKGTD